MQKTCDDQNVYHCEPYRDLFKSRLIDVDISNVMIESPYDEQDHRKLDKVADPYHPVTGNTRVAVE